MTNPALILIDEPELSLHPSLQAAFVNHLAQSTDGSVIFSTHSLGLARTTANLPIYSFKRKGNHSVVCELPDTSDFGIFLGEMSFSSFSEVNFEKILLVEGVNEIRTVMAFLDLLGNRKRFVFIPLGGGALATGGRDHELSLLRDMVTADRIAALVDSEKTAANEPPIKERTEFEASCRTLNFSVCVTERRAIENYFSDAGVKAAKGPKARAFGPYETFDKANPVGWAKNEGYRIAQKMDRADIEATDVGRFLSGL